MSLKVIVSGCAARSFEWPEDFEVWGMNGCRMLADFGKASRWFHLHGPEHIEWKHPSDAPGGLFWLQDRIDEGLPVYVPESVIEYARVRSERSITSGEESLVTIASEARPFPRRELVEEFGAYFNNSFSWLIAFAVREGATELWLDGVRYGRDPEVAGLEDWAVPCIDHHLGIAKGRGVTVRVPPGSGLLGTIWGTQLYGYEGPGAV